MILFSWSSPFYKVQGIPPVSGYTPIFYNYFFSGAGAAGFSGAAAGFSGAGAAFSGAGAAFSGAGAAGFASSFGAGFGGSAAGPQLIKEKLAKKEIAINNTTNFFIYFTSFLLLIHMILINIIQQFK
jgi:hypothetical protein